MKHKLFPDETAQTSVYAEVGSTFTVTIPKNYSFQVKQNQGHTT